MDCSARKLRDGQMSCIPCNTRWDADDEAPSCRPNPETMKLGPGESKAYALLAVGEDTLISQLYTAITGRPPLESSRDTQRYVSAIISRLNTKLTERGFAAVPGRLKQTYTLQRNG